MVIYIFLKSVKGEFYRARRDIILRREYIRERGVNGNFVAIWFSVILFSFRLGPSAENLGSPVPKTVGKYEGVN